VSTCASRILGGARVLCFVKRIQRSRSAAGIGQPVGLARVADGRTHRQPASQRVILRFHCNPYAAHSLQASYHAARRSYR
jgi:hypothetical protein